MIAKHWWKAVTIMLIGYTIIAGFLMPVPALPILNESIRNTYFHIPMWFTMIFILGLSVVNSIRYLDNFNLRYDIAAAESAKVGTAFGVLGIMTGMIWAKVTWGSWWVGQDPKLNGAAATLLIYLAYLFLRSAVDDEVKKAKISAVYSIFAYTLLIVFLLVLPRMLDSLHPGSGGNPGFGNYDLDNKMKMVFYPAVTGWIGLGFWISTLFIRARKLEGSSMRD